MEKYFITYYKSEIGLLEITGSKEEIFAVDFVEKALEKEKSNALLEDCKKQLDEYFRGKRKEFSLNLNPKGTDFQKKVWAELLKIPFGKVVSYLEIAKNIGDKNLTRAVGNANGKNPVAIIIPCHRVVGNSGKLVGYAGGLWRKKWLLEKENQQLFLEFK
ncbi:methylated-DNA--[protein]-cysteine S-methyltransferase [bacterium]|nr:methylated-DNA--[protein]-cysteine S-methyltransferase [bacterium]